MKALLVIPHGTKQGPCFDIPTNMFYMIASLRQAGIPVELADGNLIGFAGVKAKIDEMKPDAVGISVLSPARFNALLIAQSAKDAGARVILGNHHATWMHRQILTHYDYVDACALGEGEQTFVDFCTLPETEVLGIARREGNEIVVNKPRKHRELDDIPFPAWDLVNWQSYRAAGALGPRMYYSRGCWGRCKFCTSPKFWRGYRHRSAENFCDEAEWLFKLGQPECVFGDDNASNEDATALFEELLRRKGRVCIPIVCVTRVDTVTPELCKLMAQCGVQELTFGIESFSQHMLDHFDKGTTVEQNKAAIRMAKAAGMRVCALVIRNSIGETPDDKAATARCMGEFSPIGDGSVNALWLFPHSKYWDEILEGKYDSLISSGKEWVNEDFYLDPKYANHVLEFRNGTIKPVQTTE